MWKTAVTAYLEIEDQLAALHVLAANCAIDGGHW
jgi:hypothetical protein